MTYGFIVLYRFQLMDEANAKKAREFWSKYLKEDWPADLKLLGDYRHAWGSEWNGFLLLETESPQTFFEFWPLFRDKTRWYVENTRTIIGLKREPKEWL